MSSPVHVRTVVEFPEVPVRVIPADGIPIGEGPLMWAMVNVARPQGTVIGVRVFAYAGEIDFLDLSTLRHRGRETTVTAWAPVIAGRPRIGPTLRAALQGGLETVEVTEHGPIYRTAA
ncbi:hypothetical protein [Methylobacterium ajmalii]|jgi:hypothetical protein|uniref:hypothetical protein n=1 Tax=Methylobacterium ajmalii TaxID=2738439 RepID=UPI001909B9C1|nr:hypothetical protein [Methylobacterium ajmalii]MBK3397694.1 hypothetical protein [Methylobacterium ajmalii]MBK3411701.1 hypothetical protein [Methylobacterium ajmalii]MBK3425440.1 hypothetical protein [Methylobacterium ajmalii]MBZ6414800.1 hypothetical protein [Methylobacterium sp.]